MTSPVNLPMLREMLLSLAQVEGSLLMAAEYIKENIGAASKLTELQELLNAVEDAQRNIYAARIPLRTVVSSAGHSGALGYFEFDH